MKGSIWTEKTRRLAVKELFYIVNLYEGQRYAENGKFKTLRIIFSENGKATHIGKDNNYTVWLSDILARLKK